MISTHAAGTSNIGYQCLYIATRHSTIPQKFTMVNIHFRKKIAQCLLQVGLHKGEETKATQHLLLHGLGVVCCGTFSRTHPPPPPHTHTHTHMHMHTHMNLHARQQHMTLILRHYINKKDSCTKRCTFWGVTTYHIEIRLETSGLHFLHARSQPGSYRPWHVLCNVWLHRPAFLKEM